MAETDDDERAREARGDIEFQMDKRLIEAWFAIPAEQNIELEIPRVSLDLLYTAVETPYFAIIEAVKLMMNNTEENRKVALPELDRVLRRGMNHLRHFQTLAMLSATNGRYDAEGNLHLVPGEGERS